MAKYRILALDGGGVGGLVTATLLRNLCNKPGLEEAFDSADLIAGNSSGGLIALALAHGLGEDRMVNTLEKLIRVFESGGNVFGPALPWWLGGFWLFSKHRTRDRERTFRAALGNRRLSDFKKKVLITTFDLDDEAANEKQNLDNKGRAPRRWKPKLFHNFVRLDDPDADHERRFRKPDRDHFAWEVALYTSAAPSYFPSVDGYIDGGVYANNPSMCALAQAFDGRYEGAAARQLGDVALLSVSAGRNAKFIKEKTLFGGALWWGTRYVGITMDGTVGVADYQCGQMLGPSRYRRIDADYPAGMKVRLDDVKKIGALKRLADEIPLDEHAQWLRQNWGVGPEQGNTQQPGGTATLTDVKSKHLLDISELTCLMPIKPGFVGEFETRTYATRLRIAMKVLNGLRVASREIAAARVFPDIVDVIRGIHSFQLSVVGNSQLLLSVTFDGAWESYMRLVWKGLGPLLDVLLINCVDYEAHASDKGFDRFSAWVRRHQIDTGLFYTASPYSVDDIRYLAQFERAQRNNASPEAFANAVPTMVALDPVAEARKAAKDNPRLVQEGGLKALSAFYALRESYPSKTPRGADLPDAGYLRRAARETLKEFKTEDLPHTVRQQFRSELEWFEGGDRSADGDVRPPDYKEMQGGILREDQKPGAKARVAHGCLLLARVVNPRQARAFLKDTLLPRVSRHQERRTVYTNVAFTFRGLRRLGVSPTDLATFPKEFREGMEERAGLLGDVHGNHPSKWSLPEWNWPNRPKGARAPVRLSTIDLVVKMRISGPDGTCEHAWSENHPLYKEATDLFADPSETGVQVMSVQPMLQHVENEKIIDHFGFVDGISQPKARADRDRDAKDSKWNDEVALGELFLGYRNDREDPPFGKEGDPDALPGKVMGSLLDNGTFLVVRKLEQHVGTLDKILKAFKDAPENKDLGLDRDDVLARLFGRKLNGDPLTPNSKPQGPNQPFPDNTFTYEGDDGSGCPLHAHIRRGNPREGRVPRIMRRGMTYGPLCRPRDGEREDHPGAERGMMFLAYNASIGEQFEVIQRWMAGGNSTAGFSEHADPCLRVPREDENGVFRFVHNGRVCRVNLGREPLVSLKWGMYLFVPSISAIQLIAEGPKPEVEKAEEQARIALGERVMATLRTDGDWSAILEDVTASSSGANAAVYAAVRARGGVLRTPTGGMVLVATEPLVMEVLRNDKVFSVSEYRKRMAASIGETYLGLDYGDKYKELSQINELVSGIREVEAFGIAEKTTREVLSQIPSINGPATVPLDLLADEVLAGLSWYWFGIPDGTNIKKGRPPAQGPGVYLPHHSLAPSRYIFSSPHPREVVTAAGHRLGDELRGAVTKLAKEKGLGAFATPIATGIWKAATTENGTDHDLFARMLIGLIEGFIPTVYGNFLKTMHVWIADETLWRVQQDVLSYPVAANAVESFNRAYATIGLALKSAMQARPVPDLLYRTATERYKLGSLVIEPGERVVALIASATHELAGKHKVDVMPVFGGDRANSSHPTHACPAYKMGMGVLLGMLSGLLQSGVLTSEGPLAVTVALFADSLKLVEPQEKVGV